MCGQIIGTYKHENLGLELHLVTPAKMLLKEKKLQYEVFDD